ncbi:chitosanase [Streptomyces sp. NPDC047097]|uniref:chitosanase n=1 Tax=Streptomyces sp. NPDC047097 TaxID=3155260 RepID=UPI0033CB9F5C
MTRFVLIGAPIALVVSVVLGGGDGDERPIEDLAQSEVENPLKTGDRKKEKALKDEIASMPAGLAAPDKKELAARLIASADNSTLDWRGQYDDIEDLGDGNGYTAGVIGFCSGTNDMLQLVEHYTEEHPGNPLAPFLPALREVDGSDSHEGLDPGFTEAWKKASKLPEFRAAQDEIRDRIYFDPAVDLAKMDGLSTLGQFVYYDAMVLHGPGLSSDGFYGIRHAALKAVKTPSEGGDEKKYLDAFLDASREIMKNARSERERDTSRIDTAQREFLRAGNTELRLPLVWRTYGESFRVERL